MHLFGVVIFITCSIGWSAEAHALEVLSIGDSITQGLQRTYSGVVFGITSPRFGAANVGGYQVRLNTKLDANIEPSSVYNWGFQGELSAGFNPISGAPGGVNRIGSVLNSRPADYILIMYGANDLYAGISSSSTSANLGNMIDQSRARDVIPIISEITPNTLFRNGFFDFLISNDYNPKLKAVAAQKETPIVLMYSKMRSEWNRLYDSGDGLHLNSNGYNRMGEEWFEVLEKVHQANNRNIVPLLLPLLLE